MYMYMYKYMYIYIYIYIIKSNQVPIGLFLSQWMQHRLAGWYGS